MILGSMMLFNVNEAPRALYNVSLTVIIPVVICTVLFFVVALSYVVKAHKHKPTTGREGIIGEIGIAATDISQTGSVKVHGEIWHAQATQPIPKSTQIIVKAVERMVLTVEEYKSN